MRAMMLLLGTVLMIGLCSQNNATAEDAPAAPPPGRQQWDPEQMRQRMLDRIKESLAPSDEEWKVLQPKIESVQKLAMQARTGGGAMFGRRRNNNAPPPENAAPKTDLEKKVQELQTLIDNKESDPKVMKTKMQEVRDVRDKAKVDLKKAQEDLRELLTPKQEAQLMLMGMLE